MSEFKPCVVIPTGENRLHNLVEVLKHLHAQTHPLEQIVVVCDGFDSAKAKVAVGNSDPWLDTKVEIIESPKHVPGKGTLQPKNVGAIWADENTDCTHLWFLDSDIIVGPDCLREYWEAQKQEFSWHECAVLNERIQEPRIMIGPYSWLPEGNREITSGLKNDPRENMFVEFGPSYTSVGELNFALANFGGNIMYPLEAFKRVGGFWDELHTGRCEDGCMGLQCASAGIPMCVVPEARGWHLWHQVNMERNLEVNAIDVPKINEKFPEVESQGIVLSDKDGARLDWINPETGEQVNTLEIWNYKSELFRRNNG